MSEKELIDAVKEIPEENRKSFSEQIVKHLYLDSKTKGVLDTVQEKLVSRKLLVFITSTVLLAYVGLDPDIWGMIAMCYIGGQSVIDFAKVWKGLE